MPKVCIVVLHIYRCICANFNAVYIVNALCMHAHESYISYHSSTSVQRVCDKLNLPARSLLNSEGCQLADFTKRLSFQSYIACFSFSHGQDGHICNSVKLPSGKFNWWPIRTSVKAPTVFMANSVLSVLHFSAFICELLQCANFNYTHPITYFQMYMAGIHVSLLVIAAAVVVLFCINERNKRRWIAWENKEKVLWEW